MNIGQLFEQLNWVDYGLAAVLLVSAAAGVRQGLLSGGLELAGMMIALEAGVLGAPSLIPIIMQATEAPRAIATFAAFLVIAMVAHLVFSLAVGLLFHAGHPLRKLLGHLRLVDRILGAVPGAIKGGLTAILVLLPFSLFPLMPPVSAAIDRSLVGSRVISAIVGQVPEMQATLRAELSEGLSFLTPRPTEEGLQVKLGMLGRLEPDPAAEAEMLDLVNRERVKAGLKPFQLDPQLREVGRGYSQEMFQSGYIAHNSSISGAPEDRLRRAGVTYRIAGENLGFAPTVQSAHDGFMQSPSHRENILRPEFGRIGIGVIKSEIRGRMFTQQFAD
ncbi:MAG: CvpA family protein [Chloroflexi bacterium]|nr:CvpA family protein [Chloroflexota bacterium]